MTASVCDVGALTGYTYCATEEYQVPTLAMQVPNLSPTCARSRHAPDSFAGFAHSLQACLLLLCCRSTQCRRAGQGDVQGLSELPLESWVQNHFSVTVPGMRLKS